jgi:hypothetical protein
MAGVGRNYWLAAALLAVMAGGALVLPSATWSCAFAALVALTGVVLLRSNGWRTAALLTAAIALGLAMLDAFAGVLTPAPRGAGLVKTTVPRWWPPPDPILGYRPLPNSEAINTATFGTEVVYRQVYHFDADAARVTPSAPPGAPTFLFIGDSFTFGQGLRDDQTVASQFAELNDRQVHAVNLGVPGYGLNHLVRAFEAGLLDRYAARRVKAVVIWLIPAQLGRATGEGRWLGSSPRYVLEDGRLRYTGSFDDHRLRNPLAGARYYLGRTFEFVDAIGRAQRQAEQIDLYLAMLARLQQYARDKFGAPLIAVYSWPDEQSAPGYGTSEFAQPMLVSVLGRIRELGIPLVSVNSLTRDIPVSKLLIEHDGHPSAFTDGLIAAELKRRLMSQ